MIPHPAILVTAAIISLSFAVDAIRAPSAILGSSGWIMAAGLYAWIAWKVCAKAKEGRS